MTSPAAPPAGALSGGEAGASHTQGEAQSEELGSDAGRTQVGAQVRRGRGAGEGLGCGRQGVRLDCELFVCEHPALGVMGGSGDESGSWGSPLGEWVSKTDPEGGRGRCPNTRALLSRVSRLPRGSRPTDPGRPHSSAPSSASGSPPPPTMADGEGAGGRGQAAVFAAAGVGSSGPRGPDRGRGGSSGPGAGPSGGGGAPGPPRARPFPARPDWSACDGPAPRRPRPPTSKNTVSAASLRSVAASTAETLEEK